jgi:hypothetical protein
MGLIKTIELYGKGDCREGGGLFVSNHRFWLNDRDFSPNDFKDFQFHEIQAPY